MNTISNEPENRRGGLTWTEAVESYFRMFCSPAGSIVFSALSFIIPFEELKALLADESIDCGTKGIGLNRLVDSTKLTAIAASFPEETLKAALSKARQFGAHDPALVAVTALREARVHFDPQYKCSAEAFFDRCLYRRVKDDLRKHWNHTSRLQEIDDSFPETQEKEDEPSDSIPILIGALNSLPPKDATLLHLRFWEELSFDEIGEMDVFKGVSSAALRKRSSRLLSKLKSGLTPEFQNN